MLKLQHIRVKPKSLNDISVGHVFTYSGMSNSSLYLRTAIGAVGITNGYIHKSEEFTSGKAFIDLGKIEVEELTQ